jgi:hypothetical protein
MLNYHLLDRCMNCGSQETKVTLDELSEEMKKEVRGYKEEVYYLHCSHCLEYSIIWE